MTKRIFEPITALMPLPAVMVSCQRPNEKPNIITLAWTGIVCSDPPMLSISVRKNRYSHDIIQSTGEFVVNITTKDLARATDLCGIVSGRNQNKFELAGLTPVMGDKVKAPLIAESPINLECRTKTVLELGSHDMFVAEIVATHIDENILEGDGRVNIEKMNLLVYCTQARQYWAGLSTMIGKHSFTSAELKARGKS